MKRTNQFMIVDTDLNFNFMKKNYTICDRSKYMCYASEGSIVIFSRKADNTKRPRTVERSQYKNISISIARKELWIALN